VRDGAGIFDDSFDRNATLNGGSGSIIPSGTTFSDGTPANYFVQGSIPLTTLNNGQAEVNTANGVLIHQSPPNIPLIQQINMGLITGTNASLPHALTPSNTFSAIGLFDLAVPSVVLGRYYFYLGNNSATPGREVRIQVRQTDTGPFCCSYG
jgi:hypothetical protein